MTVYIIHENDSWLPPIRQALESLNLSYIEWNLGDIHSYSLTQEPDRNGIYFNRISPSSHTRNHRYSCEITNQVLDYLSLHSCRIINDQRALALELSKVKQYVQLEQKQIRCPKTAFVASASALSAADPSTKKQAFLDTLRATATTNFFDSTSKQWKPFVSKHNRAGKGLGVHLFFNDKQLVDQFEKLFDDNNNLEEEFSIDGIYLLQEYIKSPRKVINRAEFIGYQLMYIIEVDTQQGFQLCPSDACRKTADDKLVKQSIDEIKHGFNIRAPETFTDKEKELIAQLESFLRDNQIEIAGIEYVDDGSNLFVYDVNCNTNYNVAAEKRFYGNMYGSLHMAKYFKKIIDKQ